MKINLKNIKKAREELANSYTPKLFEAVQVSKINCPVDTSSLETSIQGTVDVQGESIKLIIAAGGKDYSGQIMPSTGEMGNVVDYAAEQELIHGFLDAGMNHLLSNI